MFHKIAFFTLTLLLLLPSAASSSNNNIRRKTQSLGWLYATEAKQSCTEACEAVGGVCNLEAQNAIDSVEKLQYVVQVELKTVQGLTTMHDTAATTFQQGSAEENPSYSNFQNLDAYYFSTADSLEPSTCDGADADSFRICCCGSTADCPVAETPPPAR